MQPLILDYVFSDSSEGTSRLGMRFRNQTNSRVWVIPKNPQRKRHAQDSGLPMLNWSENHRSVVLLDGSHPFAMMGRRSETEHVLEERGEIPSRQLDS